MTPPLPSEPALVCGYTEDQWELWYLRQEVKRLQEESDRLTGAAQSESSSIDDPEHNPHPDLVSDTDWALWQTRKAQFKETKELQQPDLTFAERMRERDICRTHKGESLNNMSE